MNRYLKRMMLWMTATVVIVVVRYYPPHRDAQLQEKCHNVLRQVQAGASSWALEQGHSTGFPVDQEEVSSYVKGGRPTVVCGKGGEINWGLVGGEPTCSIHGPARYE